MIKKWHGWSGATLGIFALAASASAGGLDTTVTFDNGAEGWNGPQGIGGMTYIDPKGGNPGAHLHTEFFDFGVTWRTSTNEAFLGDLTGYASVTVSLDVKVDGIFSSTGNPVPRDLIVDFRSTDLAQDSFPWSSVWYTLTTMQTGQDWMTLSITFDPNSTELPDGWGGFGAEESDGAPILPPNLTFADIMANVNELVFTTLKPGFFFTFDNYDIRIDNISISATAQPEVIYETNDPFGSFLGINGFDVFENQSVAVRFTPQGDFDLHSVGLWLWNNDQSQPRPITISLRPDFVDPIVGSIPSDMILESWSGEVPTTGLFSPQLFTFESMDHPLLMTGVNYWLVAESDTPGMFSPVWAWAANDSGLSSTTNFLTGEWQPISGGAVPATLITGVPSTGPLGDLNGDGVVNGADLAALLAQWGTGGAADLNNDGVVDGADLATLLANWTS